MERIGLVHHPKRRPNGVTKADRVARKSDDLLKRDFQADKPLEKCVTDITEIKAKDGKLYVSAMFDCFDLTVLGLAMGTKQYGIRQSMNSDGGRCHNNARCESMWARMESELFYSRRETPEIFCRSGCRRTDGSHPRNCPHHPRHSDSGASRIYPGK